MNMSTNASNPAPDSGSFSRRRQADLSLPGQLVFLPLPPAKA